MGHIDKFQENIVSTLSPVGFSANINGIDSKLSVFRAIQIDDDSIVAENQVVGSQWFGIKLMAGLDNADLRETFAEVHELLGIAMLVVLAVHVRGALKHRFIDKDDTMKRMSLRK
jgi:hypothetical protein